MEVDLLDVRVFKSAMRAWLVSNIPDAWGVSKVSSRYRAIRAMGSIGPLLWELTFTSTRLEDAACATLRIGDDSSDFSDDARWGGGAKGPIPREWTYRPTFEMQERIGREASYYTNREKVKKIYWMFSGEGKTLVPIENEQQLELYLALVAPAAVNWAERIICKQGACLNANKLGG